MPDIHWGYGFPIGGVAAFDSEHGVISPGGVGYDINCGVRLMATSLTRQQIQPKLQVLIESLFHNIPTGVGENVARCHPPVEQAAGVTGLAQPAGAAHPTTTPGRTRWLGQSLRFVCAESHRPSRPCPRA